MKKPHQDTRVGQPRKQFVPLVSLSSVGSWSPWALQNKTAYCNLRTACTNPQATNLKGASLLQAMNCHQCTIVPRFFQGHLPMKGPGHPEEQSCSQRTPFHSLLLLFRCKDRVSQGGATLDWTGPNTIRPVPQTPQPSLWHPETGVPIGCQMLIWADHPWLPHDADLRKSRTLPDASIACAHSHAFPALDLQSLHWDETFSTCPLPILETPCLSTSCSSLPAHADHMQRLFFQGLPKGVETAKHSTSQASTYILISSRRNNIAPHDEWNEGKETCLRSPKKTLASRVHRHNFQYDDDELLSSERTTMIYRCSHKFIKLQSSLYCFKFQHEQQWWEQITNC